ncbi:MAG TPA: hypothetical protein PKY77_23545 [Phycisphaerae bacterium]|nr:hypothetical protein [Phycisphaerae bacterium]HRY71018.1 hypothetical protein [Phycisphaerae bacterium]HSA29310.1 hypothetical protein [Phycisphaerae bacterium]
MRPARLTESLIPGWTDAHFEREGKWPSQRSGSILGVPGENGKNIHTSLGTDSGACLGATPSLSDLAD